MADDKIQYLILDRRDPSCTTARYYVLAVEPSRFGDATLIREWGRIGRQGQRRIELYDRYDVSGVLIAPYVRVSERRD